MPPSFKCHYIYTVTGSSMPIKSFGDKLAANSANGDVGHPGNLPRSADALQLEVFAYVCWTEHEYLSM